MGTIGTFSGQPVPFASLRFFRVDAGPNGKLVSFLLGTALADQAGSYKVMVPIATVPH